jgi:hypothetical protein
MAKPELLSEKAIAQRGRFQRVRRWWRGIHPDKGVITKGWSGWETVEERDRPWPLHTYWVTRTHHPGPISNTRNGG